MYLGSRPKARFPQTCLGGRPFFMGAKCLMTHLGVLKSTEEFSTLVRTTTALNGDRVNCLTPIERRRAGLTFRQQPTKSQQ